MNLSFDFVDRRGHLKVAEDQAKMSRRKTSEKAASELFLQVERNARENYRRWKKTGKSERKTIRCRAIRSLKIGKEIGRDFGENDDPFTQSTNARSSEIKQKMKTIQRNNVNSSEVSLQSIFNENMRR